MTIDINQFWNLLTESQLLLPVQIQTLFSEFSADPGLDKKPESLAKWMVNRGAISPYHAEILLAGHRGPFQYGNYGVVDRITDGPMAGCFTARHRKTGYGVLLKFMQGKTADDLELWKRVERKCEQLSAAESRFLNPVYEASVLPQHRFVVVGVPTGKSIQRMPKKSRLPWQQSCAVAAQVGRALQALHEQGLVHGGLDESSVWMQPSGDVRLQLDPILTETKFESLDAEAQTSRLLCMAPEIHKAMETQPWSPKLITPSAEVYSLGCILIRLLTARSYCSETEPKKIADFHLSSSQPDLEKYELTDELQTLILRMLKSDPGQRPSMSEVANLLSLYSGRTAQFEETVENEDATQAAYLENIRQFVGTSSSAEDVPPIQIDVEDHSGDEPTVDAEARIQAAREKAELRKKQKWKTPVAITLGLIGLLGIGTGGLAYLNSLTDETPVVQNGEPKNGNGDPRPVETTKDDQPAIAGDPDAAFQQRLVEDDDETLWESPTAGQPVPFSYLPTSPKMLLHARVSELVQHEEGQRLLKSFGPEFEATIQTFQTRVGLELENIGQLTLAFLDDDQVAGYDVFAVVETQQPISKSRLLELWRQPNATTNEAGVEYFQSNDSLAYLIIEAATENADGLEGRTRFAVGSPAMIEDVLEIAGGVPLGGSLQNVAEWSDSKRHVNFLFLRPSLFNDRGQAWMGPQLADFNRELSVMIPDGVQGGSIGLHLAAGSYVEVRFDRIVDLTAGALRQRMETDLRARRDQLTDYIGLIQPNAYWDRVRVKYAGMLADVSRRFRWSVERREVVGNCWLPPSAAHNLVAASELVSSFAAGSGAVVMTDQPKAPQSLQELLAAKRDLEIANPPDLNVLMADLKTEIDSDYGGLPFDWDIKLIGADLEADGITKNQRPGELVMNQKSLSEILTSIMVSANPSKDITGASDPNCKLIWVVAEDPVGSGKRSILITTRAAAASKGYELPQPFQTN
ncbi:MAG: protein kinase [Planctomycetota bacterium]